jgi:hypothetical protein
MNSSNYLNLKHFIEEKFELSSPLEDREWEFLCQKSPLKDIIYISDKTQISLKEKYMILLDYFKYDSCWPLDECWYSSSTSSTNNTNQSPHCGNYVELSGPYCYCKTHSSKHHISNVEEKLKQVISNMETTENLTFEKMIEGEMLGAINRERENLKRNVTLIKTHGTDLTEEQWNKLIDDEKKQRRRNRPKTLDLF